jgi:uncharacterized protein Yka (UPF0111/DUF47 family)
MSHRRWFLPAEPDVIGLLRRQLTITLEGLELFAAWAHGDPAAAEAVRAREHAADAAKRELLVQLRAAFVTAVEPEDVFALSRGIDWILNHARDVIAEAEVMDATADEGIAAMADLLVEAMRHVDDAVAAMGSDSDAATAAADAALHAERRLERSYYEGMGGLLEEPEMRRRIARRELYRRVSQIGETLVDVAERIVYVVVKES